MPASFEIHDDRAAPPAFRNVKSSTLVALGEGEVVILTPCNRRSNVEGLVSSPWRYGHLRTDFAAKDEACQLENFIQA